MIKIVVIIILMSCLFTGMQGVWTSSDGSWHFCRISICLFAKALKQIISQIVKLGKHIFYPNVYPFPKCSCDSSQCVCHRGRSGMSASVASAHWLLFLSACMNTGRRESNSKCTLWTRCLRQAQPLRLTHTNTHTHTGFTSPACAYFPLNSFTLKMLFCSVWRRTQLSQSGLPANTPHRAVAIFQHPWETQEPAGTTGCFIQMFTHLYAFSLESELWMNMHLQKKPKPK